MKVFLVKITPKKAAEWLQRNVNNRPLNLRQVTEIADAMTKGEWVVNGETIKRNCNGDLIDGQHRLHGCIRSGVAFESYVVEGVKHEAFDSIDQGAKRTIGHVFARNGYRHYSLLASAVRWIWRYEGGMKFTGGIRPAVAKEVLERHPGIHAGAEMASQLMRHKLINPSLLAFLIYWTGQNDSEKSKKFWTSVAEGEGLQRGSPAHVLHGKLVSNLGSVGKFPPDTLAAFCIKAWNCHFQGKKLGTLKWLDTEEFPTILF